MIKRLVSRLTDGLVLGQYARIKQQTHGYLSPLIYRSIHDCAMYAREGAFVDIGPAQGGSSIAIGLGLRDSGKTRSRVFSIEKCTGSAALINDQNAERNAMVWHDNIENHGLGSLCQLLVGDVADVYAQVDGRDGISMLFIDADGAIDRDFRLFFNQLHDDAPIVIDDYVDTINRLAREKYLQWHSEEDISRYVASKGAATFCDLCPLGKEYTTYQLVNYFVASGLVDVTQVINATLFATKRRGATYDPNVHEIGTKQIRELILEDYYRLNPNLTYITV